jgi:hypothetical protein
MQSMGKNYIVAKKKLHQRLPNSKKKITLMGKKVYIDAKKKTLWMKKFTIFVKNMPKSSYEVNQCEPR